MKWHFILLFASVKNFADLFYISEQLEIALLQLGCRVGIFAFISVIACFAFMMQDNKFGRSVFIFTKVFETAFP